ncbi:hypothetical protein GALMADRAFT_144273 [Galerina marginata CBS 339.88]|uniref:F-box domain-containing protein n=1 Tax=Galerina marginata (strain CBS 339.88) TaxID=685588 RepID=A0A067SVH7_GALM3|nr:hypothetical protein GALMADRAFT_144273 [Galerina marginata CBS 339.88]
MREVSLINLPVELHTSILMFLLSLSRKPSAGATEIALLLGFTPPPGPDLVVWEWKEHDTRSGTLFPFNVSRVCKLWHDILARIPECWTRVVFDLVSYPDLFLDAFTWSRNLENIEVVVFSSSEYTADVDEEREKRRVSAIAQALQPHVHRCQSITFDIIYSSSLPPPSVFFLQDAPNLQQLILECRVDNFDLTSHVPSPNLEGVRLPFATSFTKLWKLSLPGFWLIDMPLSTPDSEWLNKLDSSKMDVAIANFEFPQTGQYSLTNFLHCLCQLKEPNSISFQSLSLSYGYCGDNFNSLHSANLTYAISSNIHFTTVSEGFLAHLYSIADIVSDEILSFEDCAIPNISHLQYVRYIHLENIVDDQGQSLRNILAAWEGTSLSIQSCSSFDDTFLSWLSSVQEYIRIDTEGNRVLIKAFPAENLTSLRITDCVNFTAPALMEVVKSRSDSHLELEESGLDRPPYTSPRDSLSVTGRGPPFTLGNVSLDWLYKKSDYIKVNWHTENDEEEEQWYANG